MNYKINSETEVSYKYFKIIQKEANKKDSFKFVKRKKEAYEMLKKIRNNEI